MLPPGHLAATYILIKAVGSLGYQIPWPETLVVLVSSLILDFDLLPANLLKRSHRDLISHTPFGAFILWLIFIFIAGNYLSAAANLLILASLLLHLMMDQAGYWLCRLGLQGVSQEPQITWKYPWQNFPKRKKTEVFKLNFFREYLEKARANVAAEIILVIAAILLVFV